MPRPSCIQSMVPPLIHVQDIGHIWVQICFMMLCEMKSSLPSAALPCVQTLWCLAVPASLSKLNLAFSPFAFFKLSSSPSQFKDTVAIFRPSLTSQTTRRSVEQWNPWFIAQIISYVPLEDRLQRLLSYYKHLYTRKCTHRRMSERWVQGKSWSPEETCLRES